MKDVRHEEYGNDGDYVVKKSKKNNVFAFIVCVLIALTIWIYTKNTEIKPDLPNGEGAASSSVTSISDES